MPSSSSINHCGIPRSRAHPGDIIVGFDFVHFCLLRASDNIAASAISNAEVFAGLYQAVISTYNKSSGESFFNYVRIVSTTLQSRHLLSDSNTAKSMPGLPVSWLLFGILLLTLRWTTSAAFVDIRPRLELCGRRRCWRTATKLLDSRARLSDPTKASPPPVVITLKPSPLLGGPKWLQVHVKVVLVASGSGETHSWDFVPMNATQPETLVKLLSLRAVSGELRYQSRPARQISFSDSNGNDGEEEDNSLRTTTAIATKELVARANEFCVTYSPDLHLVRNNCWTFALCLLNHLNQRED
jgi:hypothetical protein